MIVFMAAESGALIGLLAGAGLPLVLSSSRVNGQWCEAGLADQSTKVAGGDQRQCQDGGPDHLAVFWWPELYSD